TANEVQFPRAGAPPGRRFPVRRGRHRQESRCLAKKVADASGQTAGAPQRPSVKLNVEAAKGFVSKSPGHVIQGRVSSHDSVSSTIKTRREPYCPPESRSFALVGFKDEVKLMGREVHFPSASKSAPLH